MTAINRRRFFASASAPLLAQRPAPPSRPNILLILADDLAAWMLGCYGNLEIRTTNIDLLARSGVRFLNSFVCTPICSASRATLFTGRVPRQHGIHDFLTGNPVADPPQGQAAPPAAFDNEIFVSQLLARQGYSCGYVGKWHLGRDENPGRGFDFTATVLARRYQDPTFHVNGNPVEQKGYLTEIKTRYACDFLDRQTADRPFFLTVSYLNPHTPYDGHPQRYYDLYKDVKFDSIGWEPAAANALREKELLKDTVGNIRRCAASVTALDDQIPALLRKLEERRLRDNTLVIFTGDNGFLLGRHGLWSKGLASNPINMYEEVMQVPLLLHWRGRIPVESVRPELVSFYDFLPAVCEAAGVTLPAGRRYCGRSYLPLATGRPLPPNQPWPVHVFGHFRNTEMARDGRYKLILRNSGDGPNELYDLRADPREKTNQFGNPGFITVSSRLRAALDAWRKATGEPAG